METLVTDEEEKREESHPVTQTNEQPVVSTRPEEPGGENTPQPDVAPLGPEDVLCDSCIESPSRARKSCLTCRVSYCPAHLRPHLENVKFQNHRLVEPLQDIECRTCDLHHAPLELYCLLDGCCVCRECEGAEHQGHGATPVGEARRQIETELQKKQEEIAKTMAAAENAISKLQSNNASIECSVAEVRAVVNQQFCLLQGAVEEARRGAADLLEAGQRQAFRQAEGIQAHLEQRRAELKKTSARLGKLSRNKTDFDFLQEYSEWKKKAVNVGLPAVYISRMDHLSSFSQVVTEATMELCDRLLSTYRDRLREICKTGEKLVQSKVSEVQPLSLPDPETRHDFLEYVSTVTFDPDTAHKYLRLTDDNKKVTNTSPWQHSYPEVPGRFDYWRQVMTSQSHYLGRHYFEVELSGEGAHVGLTYNSIDRKGQESSSCITGNDFSWCLGRERRGFSTWHSDVETPLEASVVTRVGIYVDFASGLLSFYNVTDTMTLLHRYKADFMEPLYLTVWLPKKDNVVYLSPKVSPPQNSATSTAPLEMLPAAIPES